MKYAEFCPINFFIAAAGGEADGRPGHSLGGSRQEAGTPQKAAGWPLVELA